jgi:queuine tRNA-ribosyltransferase
MFRKLSSEGALFKSHLDGSQHLLTPENVVEIQTELGSDIMMPLDVCTPPDINQEEALNALKLTTAWADRSKNRLDRIEQSGLLFGIVQGNFFKDLRRRSVEEIIDIGFNGYALGGLSVGESFDTFQEILNHSAQLLPRSAPRYLMGIGTPDYILEAVENGIDLFDCVFPTRTARNAQAFTHEGTLSLKNEANKFSSEPIDPECTCPVCRLHSRAYLRHLFKSKEILASMLTTYHNLFFLQRFIGQICKAIEGKRFLSFKRAFLDRYRARS